MVANVRPSEKRCPRCKLVKPAAEWAKSKRNAGGLWSYCRQCDTERTKERRNRQWLNGDEEAMRRKVRAWYRENKGVLERACSRCGVTKKYKHFYVAPNHFGVRPVCRECYRDDNRTRYHGNREHEIARSLERRNAMRACLCGGPLMDGTAMCHRCADLDGHTVHERAFISALRSLGGVATRDAVCLEMGYSHKVDRPSHERMMVAANRRMYRALLTLEARGRVRVYRDDEGNEESLYVLVEPAPGLRSGDVGG